MATELTHRFEDPSLGGNPLNGTFLLNQANEQNKFTESHAAKAPLTAIERFKQSLESAILNQVSRSSVSNLMDANGNIQLGSNLNFDLNGDGQSDFSVVVSDSVDANGNVTISISDGISNTVLTVPRATTL
jgi:curli production assembly/transport component CsgF